MPYRHDLKSVILECATDPAHQTYQKKTTNKRYLSGPGGALVEVDILTQQPTTELAAITDYDTALAAVRQSITVGNFTGQQTEIQIQHMATLALAYRLDPLMGEIVPMYGQPYITIKGRRRLDDAAGNRFGLSWKVPDPAFLAYYQSVGAIEKGDVVAVAIGSYAGTTDTVEVWARCKVREVAGNDPHLPINAWKLEMAMKRAERKLRETMFGPIPIPKGLEHIEVLQEGDEENIVDSTGRVVVEENAALPDLGNCPEHGVPWKVEDRYNRIVGSHPVPGAPFCKLDKVYGARFLGAYNVAFGESTKAQVDTWLKATFQGKTWSKMDALEQIEALTLLTTIPGDAEGAVQPPVDTGVGETPAGADTPQESPQVATDGISAEQVAGLLLEIQGGVPYGRFIDHVEEMTGSQDPTGLRVGQYQEMLAWIRQEVDLVAQAEMEAAAGPP